MDTILFSSDLHGSWPALKLLIVKATKIQAKALLIAGDLCPPDNPAFFLTYSNSEIPIILVRGNCDSAYDFDLAHIPLPPVTRKINFAMRTIVMTHGDRFPSPYGLELKRMDIFISGHTHTPKLVEDSQGIICVNPGSPTYPRTALGPTYGIIDETGISIRDFNNDTPIPNLQYYFMPRMVQ